MGDDLFKNINIELGWDDYVAITKLKKEMGWNWTETLVNLYKTYEELKDE